jgi:hypothetical protein
MRHSAPTIGWMRGRRSLSSRSCSVTPTSGSPAATRTCPRPWLQMAPSESAARSSGLRHEQPLQVIGSPTATSGSLPMMRLMTVPSWPSRLACAT